MLDNPQIEKKQKYSPLTVIAGGYLMVLYIVLCISIVVLGTVQTKTLISPTPTATAIPTPHILVHAPVDQNSTSYEDFSSNQRDWGLYFQFGKLEITNGKLILQSNIPNGLVVGTSDQLSPVSKNYYIQADFSTDTEKASSFGLIFGLNKNLITFYAFELWPSTGGFQFLKYNSGKWTQLIPYTITEINPYPQANILSVNFDNGHIELYINGKLASEYSDIDFYQSKGIGIFTENMGYRVFVDDLFVYSEK